MSDTDQTEETDFVNVWTGVDADEDVGAEGRDTVDDLEVEPAEVGRFEQDQGGELLVDALRKSLNREAGHVCLNET